MSLPDKRKIAAVCGDGHIRLIEQDVPELLPGSVLIEVHASLVSPGTELGGWRHLAELRENPVDRQPRPFGYSNAGIVLAVGGGVENFKPGDRVACTGGGYAMHTDYARVPHHLTAHLPERVTFSQGAYAMLAATALHALRRGDPDFGAFAAIIGLGLVGQLSAQIHKLAGCYVIGWDMIAFRTETARKWGIDEAVTVGAEDPIAKTRAFTDADGLDNAVFAFGGDAERAMESVLKCMKVSPDGHPMGTIVFVGQGSFHYTSRLTNIDIRRASRTGPGYHDEVWEYGPDYPPVFMRWTTRTNIALCLRLIAEGKLKVDTLTTHTIPLEDVDEAISDIIAEPDEILGVVFKMNE